MTEVLQVLQYAVSLVFVLLGIVVLRDWLLHRERSRGFLTLALGLLAVGPLIGFVQRFPVPLGPAVQLPTIVYFPAPRYPLLLNRVPQRVGLLVGV